jgi:hypothetical protein
MRVLRIISLSLATATLAAAAQGPLNSGIEVQNLASQPIKELQIKSGATAGWGENKLGGGPLAPGKTPSIRELTETNCNYQVRAVFQDGRTEQQPVDICTRQHVVLGANQL